MSERVILRNKIFMNSDKEDKGKEEEEEENYEDAEFENMG